MNSSKYLVVVYQFGKVASTSLVDSLNTLPNVEAHQSHFLGVDALKRTVENATDRKIGPYFRKHLVGQLVNNLELTYRVNRARAGYDYKSLKIISLSREPLDWLRSCIQQDIEGYHDDLIEFSGVYGGVTSVHSGLTEILDRLSIFIDTRGGMRETIREFNSPSRAQMLSDPVLGNHEIVRRMLLLALRPLIWFEEHFEKCFGFELKDIPRKESHWMLRRDGVDYTILRYEDIESELALALEDAGVPFNGILTRTNVSRSKPFAKEIRTAFSSDAAQKLRTFLLETDYAENFGYIGDG